MVWGGEGSDDTSMTDEGAPPRSSPIPTALLFEPNLAPQAMSSDQLDVLVLHYLLFEGPFPCAHAMTLECTMGLAGHVGRLGGGIHWG